MSWERRNSNKTVGVSSRGRAGAPSERLNALVLRRTFNHLSDAYRTFVLWIFVGHPYRWDTDDLFCLSERPAQKSQIPDNLDLTSATRPLHYILPSPRDKGSASSMLVQSNVYTPSPSHGCGGVWLERIERTLRYSIVRE